MKVRSLTSKMDIKISTLGALVLHESFQLWSKPMNLLTVMIPIIMQHNLQVNIPTGTFCSTRESEFVEAHLTIFIC